MVQANTQELRHKSYARLAIVTAALAVIFVNIGSSSSGAWTTTHWLFNYEYGFIKRGLIGTIAGGISSFYIFFGLQVAVAVSASLVLSALIDRTSVQCFRFSADGGASPLASVVALACFMLSSPGAIQQWFSDVGRFDPFGFLLLCLSYIITSNSAKVVGLISAALLSAVAILIHEGFFFWVAPMTIALWLWRHYRGIPDFALALAAGLGLTALTAFVATSDYSAFMDFDTAKAMLELRVDFDVSTLSLMVHYRDFADNLQYTSERAWSLRRLAGLSVGFAYLVGILAFILFLFGRSGIRIGLRTVFLILASFAPLALMLLGHDQGRWLAMANCSLLFVFLAWLDEDPTRIRCVGLGCVALLVPGTIVNMGLGFTGVTQAFPELPIWGLLRAVFSALAG